MHVKAVDESLEPRPRRYCVSSQTDVDVDLDSLAAQGFGDGWVSRLSAPPQPKQTRSREALLISDEVDDFRMALRQCAGLVEDDRVDSARRSICVALDDDAARAASVMTNKTRWAPRRGCRCRNRQ